MSRVKKYYIKSFDLKFNVLYNGGMENFNDIVAKNMIMYRKQAKLTQAELAQKLNYSDKAVSKWERGESLPDILIIKQIADLYGITVDDLVYERKEPVAPKHFNLAKWINVKRLIIVLMPVIAVWLAAIIAFVALSLLDIGEPYTWLCFIYAIPAMFTVLIIFSAIWWGIIPVCLFSSAFVWTTILSLYLSISSLKLYVIFYIGIPLQVLLILWCVLTLVIKRAKKIKNNAKPTL